MSPHREEDEDPERAFDGGEFHSGLPTWLVGSPIAPYYDRSAPFDPLGVLPICIRVVRERSLVLELPELVRATLTRIRLYHEAYEPALGFGAWVAERAGDAAEALLARDAEALRSDPDSIPHQGRFSDLELLLGVPPDQALRACVTLNGMDAETRFVVCEVGLRGRPERELQKDGYPLERTLELFQQALETLKEAFRRARESELDELEARLGEEARRLEEESDG